MVPVTSEFSNYKTWNGVFPAVTTPFHADLSLDLVALEKHLEVLIDSGVTGLVMMGSLGENLALSEDEKLTILKTALKVANGRIPVLTGVAETSTQKAVDYIQKAQSVGVQGAMLMPAMVYKPDREEALTHYLTVVRNTECPILIYNNPISYHVDLTPDQLEILCHESEKFFGIKESSGDVRRITDIINHLGNRLTLFAGVDDLALECAFLGATGWVAGIGLAFPYENQRLWDLAMNGQYSEALELYR